MLRNSQRFKGLPVSILSVCFIIIFISPAIFSFSLCRGYEEDESTKLFSRAETLINIAGVYIKIKKLDLALTSLENAASLAEELREPFAEAILCYAIADKYLAIGELNKALTLAEKIAFLDVKEELFSKIAYRYAVQEKGKKTLELIEQVNDDFLKAFFIYKMSEKFARTANYRAAIEILAALQDSRELKYKLVLLQILSKKAGIIKQEQWPAEYKTVFLSENERFKNCLDTIIAASYFLNFGLYNISGNLIKRADLLLAEIKVASFRENLDSRLSILRKEIQNFEKKLNRQ